MKFIDLVKQKYQSIKIQHSEVIRPPKSHYFGIVGSTNMEDVIYSVQLEIKKDVILSIFSPFQWEWNKFIFEPSPIEFEYRFKMEYVASFDPNNNSGQKSMFGQRQTGRFNKVVDIHSDVLIPSCHFIQIRQLYEFLNSNNVINFDLINKTGELRYLVYKGFKSQIMCIIVTTKKLPINLIENINKIFGRTFTSIVFLENNNLNNDNASGVKYYTINQDYLLLDILDKKFKVSYDSFFQNNISCLPKILDFVQSVLNQYQNTIRNYVFVDFFCGIGTFGIFLSKYFSKVCFIESHTGNISDLYYNILLNNINNATIQQIDLYKSLDLEFDHNSVFFLDPPRTGLGKHLISTINKVKPFLLIYLSCNPATQFNDLCALTDYKIISARGFDMFPNTFHAENCIILQKV
ncbi:MAG: RsmD family RNA methyltransferase [Candidatus Dojkabacteria bacterium]|nr:RsmD family RNA methyltransferase [Candidatus Dojkabacteria bacterium]